MSTIGASSHPTKYIYDGTSDQKGKEFEKDLAFTIFLRASLAGYNFTLATEMGYGGISKFDDVVLFIDSNVWLFQAKSAIDNDALIQYSELFPNFFWTNEDHFALPKYVQSFLAVKDHEVFRNFDQQYIIFTNKSLYPLEVETLLKIECIENVHDIVTWNRSDQNVKRFTINTDHARDAIEKCNNELGDIKEGIFTLFKKDTVTVPAVLEKYKSPLKSVLEIEQKQLKFKSSFTDKQKSSHNWLLDKLEKKFNSENLNDISRATNAQIEEFIKYSSQIKRLPNFVDDIQNEDAHRKNIQDKMNINLHIIKENIIELFKAKGASEQNKIRDGPLKNYADSLKTVLTISNETLKFHPEFLDIKTRKWLLEKLTLKDKNRKAKKPIKEFLNSFEPLPSVESGKLNAIKTGIIDLFSVPPIFSNELHKLKTPLRSMLKIDNDNLRFHSSFLNQNYSSHLELFKKLKVHFDQQNPKQNIQSIKQQAGRFIKDLFTATQPVENGSNNQDDIHMDAIRDAIISLSKGESKMLDVEKKVLNKYRDLIMSVLQASNNLLQFHPDFLDCEARHWLLEELQKHFPQPLSDKTSIANQSIKELINVQQLPKLNENQGEAVSQDTNVELNALKSAIIALFSDTGNIPDILYKYRTPLKSVLKISNGYLRFHQEFLDKNYKSLVWLFDELQASYGSKKPLAAVTLEDQSLLKDIEDFLKKKPENPLPLPTPVNNDDVNNFLSHFVLCQKQSESEVITDASIYSWMQEHFLPEDLMVDDTVNKEKTHIKYTFRDKFNKWWQKPRKNGTKTEPLNHKEGKECMDGIYEVYSVATCKSQTFKNKYVSRTINLNSNVKRASDGEFIELLKNSNEKKCYVLIGPPGIGKTTFVEYVGFEVQKTATKVLIVNLKNNSLENFKSNLSSLQPKLSNNGNQNLVIIDGFDELDQSSQDFTIKTIKDLQAMRELHGQEKNKVQIIITGRSQVQAKLENKLEVITMNLLRLSFDEQVLFLERYWIVSDEEKTQFDTFSNKLLNVFYSRLGRTDKALFPFMIQMLAEFSAGSNTVNKQVKLENFHNIENDFNILNVYEKFVEFSFNIWQEKITNGNAYSNINREINKQHVGPLYDTFISNHQWAALKFLELNTLVDKFEAKNKNENKAEYLDQFKQLIENGQQKSGLINIFSTGEFEFVDQSYAQYFVAKFIFDNKLKPNQVKDKHAFVQKFFYLMHKRKKIRA